jgi:twitching motility protein PilT
MATDFKGKALGAILLQSRMITPALAALIREGKTYQIPSLIQTQRGAGMCLMDQSLLDLVKQRIVNPAEAIEYALDRRAFQTAVDAVPRATA